MCETASQMLLKFVDEDWECYMDNRFSCSQAINNVNHIYLIRFKSSTLVPMDPNTFLLLGQRRAARSWGKKRQESQAKTFRLLRIQVAARVFKRSATSTRSPVSPKPTKHLLLACFAWAHWDAATLVFSRSCTE